MGVNPRIVPFSLPRNEKTRSSLQAVAAKATIIGTVLTLITTLPALLVQVITVYQVGAQTLGNHIVPVIFSGFLVRTIGDPRWVLMSLVDLVVLASFSGYFLLPREDIKPALSIRNYGVAIRVRVLIVSPIIYLFCSAPCTRILVFAEPSLRPWLDPMVERFNFASGTRWNMNGRYLVVVRYIASQKAKKTLIHGKDYSELTCVPTDQLPPTCTIVDEVDPFKATGFPEIDELPVLWLPIEEYWKRAFNDAMGDEDVRRREGILLRGMAEEIPQSLPVATTRLVMVVRPDRYEWIERSLKTRYHGNTCMLLQALVSKGWSAIDHPQGPLWDSEPVFLHSDPTFSNSGLMVLALAYDN